MGVLWFQIHKCWKQIQHWHWRTWYIHRLIIYKFRQHHTPHPEGFILIKCCCFFLLEKGAGVIFLQWWTQDVWGTRAKKIKWAPAVCGRAPTHRTWHIYSEVEGTLSCFISHRGIQEGTLAALSKWWEHQYILVQTVQGWCFQLCSPDPADSNDCKARCGARGCCESMILRFCGKGPSLCGQI